MTAPQNIRPVHVASRALALALALTGPVAASAAQPTAVVELFTSQGCSSCPPANDNLTKLIASRRDVLALSFGVTYWDQLGCKDPFASPVYTERQWRYARILGHSNVFTPQVVVNGRADGVGAGAGEIEALVGRTPRLTGPEVRVSSDTVSISAAAKPDAPTDVWLVRYETGVIQVPVKRGENTGRTLPHAHVVRSLVRLGSWDGKALRLPLPPSQGPLATAILVQSAKGQILSAATL